MNEWMNEYVKTVKRKAEPNKLPVKYAVLIILLESSSQKKEGNNSYFLLSL